MATYTISKDDTLNTIIKKFNINPEELLKANKGVKWKAGATINIPAPNFSPDIDYSIEINKLLQENPNADVSALVAARRAKIESDPTKYGQFMPSQLEFEQKYLKPITVTTPSTNIGNSMPNAQTPAITQPNNITQTANSYNITDYINEYKEALRKSRIAALDKARQGALSTLRAEESAIAPQYAASRQQAVALSDLGAKNFAEYLAKRGLRSSGAASQGQIAQNVALQNIMGELSRGETQALSDIARRRSDIETGYQTDVANVQADIEASVLPQLIQQLNAERQYALQQQQLAAQIAGLTGIYEGKPTLEALRLLTEQQQNAIENELERKKFEEQIRQFEKNFTESQKRWNEEFKFNQQKQTFEERQAEIENAVKNKQLSLQEAQLQLAHDKFIAENDPNSIDNRYKQAQIDALQGKGGLTYKDYFSRGNEMLDKMYYDSASQTYVKLYTPEQVKSWVLGLPISIQEKVNLLNDLGIPK
ncbi:MAG: LysM peptidoglycan-binding domain-containing protein [Firmicutes bacterium]|nr:LysM peptidoglycan-binding domain-containing protein [Bacillota bacterium]